MKLCVYHNRPLNRCSFFTVIHIVMTVDILGFESVLVGVTVSLMG